MVNYPAQIDTSISIPRAVDNQTPVASNQYNKSRDAVIAIETELGVKPSATYGTVRARLDYLETVIAAGGGVQIAQDLGGLTTAPLVIGLYGNPILSTTPTINYVLTWTGVAWDPRPPSIVGGLHNTLGDLQGGTSAEYYHLTSAQHTWLIDGVTDGYWNEIKGGTGQNTYTIGDLLYSDGLNSLDKLNIGNDGYVLSVSGNTPTWIENEHNTLVSIQGGTTNNYYHLKASEHLWLTDGYTDGYWSVNKGGTGLTSVSIGDIIYASASDTFSALSVGTDGYVLTSSGGVPIWAADSSPTFHNNLNGLQGGETDGYYHLTSTQHTWLSDGPSDGYWDETKGGTGYTSYTIGDVLYADSTTSLAKLGIGSNGQALIINSGVPSWQNISTTHNSLDGLQGGETDGYYHLTSDQHTWLTDGYTSGWSETTGGTGTTSYTTGDILYADGSNSLTTLGIGTSSQILKISGGVPTWQDLSGVLVEYGTENIAGGTGALTSLTSGQSNTAFGYNAHHSLTSARRSVAIGAYALYTSNAYDNVGIGYEAGRSSTGASNTIIGQQSGYSLSTGSDSVFVGYRAGYFTTTGSENVCIGHNSGSIFGNNCASNVSIGYFAGTGSGAISGANGNIAIGKSALNAINNGTADWNIGIGYISGYQLTSGAYNICIGYQSGKSVASSSYVIAIGRDSEISTDNSIAIGKYTQVTNTESLVIGVGSSGTSLSSIADYSATLGYKSLYLGKNAAEDITLYAYNNDANKPFIQHNTANSKWIWSDNGTNSYGFNTLSVITGKIGAVTAGTDGYFLGNFTEAADETFPAYVANDSCTLKNLSVSMSGAITAGQSVQIIIRVSEVDTSLTVTLDDSTSLSADGKSRIEQDLSNEISVDNQDKVTVRFISSASADATNVMVTFDVLK